MIWREENTSVEEESYKSAKEWPERGGKQEIELLHRDFV